MKIAFQDKDGRYTRIDVCVCEVGKNPFNKSERPFFLYEFDREGYRNRPAGLADICLTCQLPKYYPCAKCERPKRPHRGNYGSNFCFYCGYEESHAFDLKPSQPDPYFGVEKIA